MWTLIHVRHSVASIANVARVRWSGVSACRNASAASVIGLASARFGPSSVRKPARTTPSVVTPTNGLREVGGALVDDVEDHRRGVLDTRPRRHRRQRRDPEPSPLVLAPVVLAADAAC